MPKDVNIQPGQSFHLPAAQEKNVDSLLKILSKKEATDALKGLGDMDSETWGAMNSTVSTLKEVIELGGSSVVFQDLKTWVEEIIMGQINLALAPLKNELSHITNTMLQPMYDWLNDITNDLAKFISDYDTGAFWGAMVGSIWGEFGGLLGGLLGAAFQGFWENFFVPFWEDAWVNFWRDVIGDISDDLPDEDSPIWEHPWWPF